jgi:hypothetical protein
VSHSYWVTEPGVKVTLCLHSQPQETDPRSSGKVLSRILWLESLTSSSWRTQVSLPHKEATWKASLLQACRQIPPHGARNVLPETMLVTLSIPGHLAMAERLGGEEMGIMLLLLLPGHLPSGQSHTLLFVGGHEAARCLTCLSHSCHLWNCSLHRSPRLLPLASTACGNA